MRSAPWAAFHHHLQTEYKERKHSKSTLLPQLQILSNIKVQKEKEHCANSTVVDMWGPQTGHHPPQLKPLPRGPGPREGSWQEEGQLGTSVLGCQRGDRRQELTGETQAPPDRSVPQAHYHLISFLANPTASPPPPNRSPARRVLRCPPPPNSQEERRQGSGLAASAPVVPEAGGGGLGNSSLRPR